MTITFDKYDKIADAVNTFPEPEYIPDEDDFSLIKEFLNESEEKDNFLCYLIYLLERGKDIKTLNSFLNKEIQLV